MWVGLIRYFPHLNKQTLMQQLEYAISKVPIKFMNYKNQFEYILEHIKQLNAKSIVVQIPKQDLSEAIKFQNELRRALKSQTSQDTPQVYLLYDCNKKSCCTDIVGAMHVNYDCLIHFGEACFSEKYDQRHLYVFPEGVEAGKVIAEASQKADQYKIDAIMFAQQYYTHARLLVKTQAEVLTLPMDAIEERDAHYMLGYYKSQKIEVKRLLLVGFTEDFEQRVLLMQASMKLDNIYNLKGEVSANITKTLMKRLGLIEKLKQFQRFGVLVSNASTQFCQSSIRMCRDLLKSNGKACYIFMMNNLNEMKLANFPQIQAYILISCHNYSMYQQSDFKIVVATPFDLMMAFGDGSIPFHHYDFDCRHLSISTKQVEPAEQKTVQKHTTDLMLQGNQQIQVRSIFQTIAHYQTRTFQGLQFKQKKEIKKMTKGKIGLAESYKPLE